ncbi:MAG: hypothetical protein CL666_02485 [Balneola sp.]|nr:hypothetical protein [Balneola sp.]|tara:strand:- start:14062 stop:14571 length:510 start_codon:yes stop_codon:yes gene_type:complete
MKTFLKHTLTIIIGIFFVTGAAFAQQQQMPQQPEPLSPEEVTGEDLEMVASVSQAAQGIQQEADSKMRKVIEEEGMEYNRFQQIMMAMQNPQMAQQIDISSEEQQTIQSVQPELQQINNEARTQYMQAIEEEGLTPQKFQQLAVTIQSNQEVADRFEEISNEGQPEQEN